MCEGAKSTLQHKHRLYHDPHGTLDRSSRGVATGAQVVLNEDMAARSLSEYRTLASPSRIALLHELQQRGAQTVQELAEATGLHHNTAREHLKRLIEAGFVDSQAIPSTSRGRPRIRYRAARTADDQAWWSRRGASPQRGETQRRYLSLRERGVPRSPRERQVEALDDHMSECGFEAELSDDQSHVTMTHCPFRRLAKEDRRVCEVHLELVRDALGEDEGPLQANDIHPFCAPDTCTLDLRDSGENAA